jgi:hypothetical protein
MITVDPDSICEQSRRYYYDYLSSEGRKSIPEEMLIHMDKCDNCRSEAGRLKTVLAESKGTGQADSAVITNLKLHFAYIGERVTCKTTRPFLPSLAIPTLAVRVPTPITVHLDNCQQCTADIETIRQLNLTGPQLCRLGQLFADKPPEDPVCCAKARNAIDSVVAMFFRNTNARILKHFSTCPDCRRLLYQRRQSIRDGLLEKKVTDERFPCQKISAADIFDYCFPYGIDPDSDQYAMFRSSLTSHLINCPKCSDKMQQLHRTICEIDERAESEVATVYCIDESAKIARQSDDIYAGFPIRVETASGKDRVSAGQPASTIDFRTLLRRKVSPMNLKPLFKTVAAAAAVVLIAVTLLLHTPTAKAVTIAQVYKAVEKIKNVYISRFATEKTEDAQEKWVSRTSNIYMTKTGKQLVLWDIPNRIRKIKHLDTDLVGITSLSDDVIAKIEEKITGSLGLLPFPNISDLPEDAEWSRVLDNGLKATAKGIEVYDLTWVEKVYGGSATFKTWRFFVNPEINLPQRTEFYEKSPTDSEYTLVLTMIVKYLSDSEIQTVIKDASF